MMGKDEYDIRRRQLETHIRLLEERYPEPDRREAVNALQERLRRLESKREAA